MIDQNKLDSGLFAVVEKNCIEYYSTQEYIPTPMLINCVGISYSDLDKLEKFKQAEKDGRILPKGYSCVELSDNKTLAIFYPDDKNMSCEKRNYFSVSSK